MSTNEINKHLKNQYKGYTFKFMMKNKKLIMVWCVGLFGIFLVTSCDNTVEADPIIVQYSGSVMLSFNWKDARTDCPECTSTYVKVKTERYGDFDYGPYPFSFAGIHLAEVLSGYGHTVIAWVTDAGGTVIYRGVVNGVNILGGIENPAIEVDLYPRGWYPVTTSQPSINWGLNDVRMTNTGNGWIAGWDTAGARGVVFRGGADSWVLDTVPVTSTSTWKLNSIADAGDGAWAVGRDEQNSKGIILRNAGGLWVDDVAEPTVSANWELFGVDFYQTDNGWAVGRDNENSTGVILKYQTNWQAVAGPIALTDYTLIDVEALSNGFIACGRDNTAGVGFLLQWNGTNYTIHQPPAGDVADCHTAWELRDVYAVSDNEWWAVGYCESNLDPAFGMVFHYTTDLGLTRDLLPGPAGDWELNGIWADESGEAWAVGVAGGRGIIFQRDSVGNWSEVVPNTSLTNWSLNAVDFSTDWGYAVGIDNTSQRGVILRYPFPH